MSETCRYVRIETGGGPAYARVDGDDALLLGAAPWLGGVETGARVELAAARLLCPVEPRKILAIGKNYRAHAAEMGGEVPKAPLVFAKLTSSLLDPGGLVVLPRVSARVDYEAELGVVIGRRARHVRAEAALDHVFGYTALCDVTARDLQKADGQWTRAKGFDTFCPVGPSVVRGLDAHGLALRLTRNGSLCQDGNTRDMVFDVAALVSYLSAFCTLEPGDLIATGTPEGIGPLADGDRVVVAIEGIGELSFGVIAEGE